MTYARSRSRIGARPRITRYARNNADTKALSNPLLQLPLYAAFWADDPAWTDNPGVGQAVSSWRNGGTLAASGTYLDPSDGLVVNGLAIGNYAVVPHQAEMNVATIEHVECIYVADATPAATVLTSGRWLTASSIAQFSLGINIFGYVFIMTTTDGATSVFSTVPTALGSVGVTDGSWVWLRRRFKPNNGTGNRELVVHYSLDPRTTPVDDVTWTQLGSTYLGATTTLFASSTHTMTFGTFNTAQAPVATTKIAYASFGEIGAAPVVEIDFRRTAVGAFTCSTGQTVTVASTFNANQSTAGSRPTLTTSALLGGRRVVDFDGTDDRLEITTGVSLDQPFEVWWIGVLDNVASARMQLGINSASTSRYVGTTATPAWGLNAATALSGGTPATATAYLTQTTVNGASSAIKVNGSVVASGAGGALALNQIIIGAGRQAPSTYQFFQDGRTAFLGILPAASITASHRRQFALWAASFYSVPGFAAAA